MVGLYLQFATATSPRRLLLMLHCVWVRVINVIHSIAADINPDTSVAVCPSPSSSRLGMAQIVDYCREKVTLSQILTCCVNLLDK